MFCVKFLSESVPWLTIEVIPASDIIHTWFETSLSVCPSQNSQSDYLCSPLAHRHTQLCRNPKGGKP